MTPTLTIPDVTSTDYDNELSVTLVRADLTPADDSHEITTDGTNIAIVPVHSKMTSIRIKGIVKGSTGSIISFRWVLIKEPDGDSIISDLSDAAGLFHFSGQTPTQREYRKYVIAKGIFTANPSSAVNNFYVTIPKRKLRELGGFGADDIIRLLIAKDAPGTTATVDLMGNMYFKANA